MRERFVYTEKPESSESSLELRKQIESLGEKLPRFTRNLIKGLSREDEFYTKQTRQEMLRTLEVIPLNELDSEDLKRQYLKAVSWIDEKSRPQESVEDLLQAGIIISPHLNKTRTTYYDVRDTWKHAIDKVKQNEEWKSVGIKYLDLDEAIRKIGGDTLSYSLKDLLGYCDKGFASSTIAARMNITTGTINNGISHLKKIGLMAERKKNQFNKQSFDW